ncbi:uncharacterized protein LOC143024003 [Oratosquilla oratoria]|uniref:uncharacterized protein LOC143024003 n=1 Tax=Oratosquilla oratoria TaxID=337810 RepID=UPI003F768DD4
MMLPVPQHLSWKTQHFRAGRDVMETYYLIILVALVAQTTVAAPKRTPCKGASCRRVPSKAAKAVISAPPTKGTVVAPEGALVAVEGPGGEGGWLTAPTTAAPKPKTTPKVKPDKPGVCGPPKSYGIMCSQPLDQCKRDGDCPGLSKCCMIGECGYLCVSPKTKGDVEEKPVPVAEQIFKNEVEEEEEAKYIFTSEEIEGDKDSFSTLKSEDKIVMQDKTGLHDDRPTRGGKDLPQTTGEEESEETEREEEK